MRLGTIVVAGLLALPSFALAAPQDCGGADLDRRIVACTQIIQRGGQSPANMAMIYVNRGSAYGDKQDYARAIADYSKALQLNPNYADAYYSRGTVYLRMNDNDRAIADISQTLRLNPNHAYAYYNRGLAYQNKADYTRAIADYDQAVRLNPGLGDAYQHAAVALNGRGDAYLKAGDYDRAIADYDRSIQLQPNSYWPYSHRGDAYRRKGDLDRAIADLDQALRLSPGLNEALTLRGLAYRAKGDPRAAKADFSSAANSAPTGYNAEIYQEMARQQLDTLAETQTAVAAAVPNEAQAAPAVAAATLPPGKRVALVVGNSGYQNIGRLDNPANDAKLMAATLKAVGFILVGDSAQLDLDKTAFDNAVKNFGKDLQGADVALFYYAGHGVQVRGANYLVPVDANPTREADVDFQMVDVGVALRQMEAAGTKLNVVMLDACRNNPFLSRGLRASGGGLTQMQAPEGTLISFATQPDNVALDGADGNSPYTKALTKTLRKPGLDVFQTFNQVGLAVKRETGGAQQPWVSTSPIEGEFYFAGK